MTKSIREKSRQKLVRNIISGSSDFTEKAIKIKISYQKIIMHKKLEEIFKMTKAFKLDFQKIVQPFLIKNMPSLISEISKSLNIYEFELNVKIHYDYNNKINKECFTVNFYLKNKNLTIGTLVLNEDIKITTTNIYKSFFPKVQSSELLDYVKKLSTINTSNVALLVVEDSNEKMSHVNIFINNSSLKEKNKKIKERINYFFEDEKLIPLINKKIRIKNIVYRIGLVNKFLITFNYNFDFENFNLQGIYKNSNIQGVFTVFNSDYHNCNLPINDFLIVKILEEAEILPIGLVYEENKMTQEYLYDIFQQAQLLNY